MNHIQSKTFSVIFAIILFSGSVPLYSFAVEPDDTTDNDIQKIIPAANSTTFLDNYFESLNSTVITGITPIGNATVTTTEPIEIGQEVRWTHTITFNETTSNIAVEIPEDAQIEQITINNEISNSVILDGNKLEQSDDISVISSEDTELILEQSDNSTGVVTSTVEGKESVIVELDTIILTEENMDTKLVAISDGISNGVDEQIQEIEIEYTTDAPYIQETESDGANTYEKQVTIKSDSAIHYSNVRSYSSIPEEYVILGIPFELEWIINGTAVDVIEDPRFDVAFEDTDGNGLVDTMSWTVPQLSEKTFSINADTAQAEKVNVASKLEKMKLLFDDNFYDKTLDIANAKVTGNLTGYLAESREISVDDIDDEYYSVIIVVQNHDGTDRDTEIVAGESKDTLVQILQEKHNAKDVYRADKLSFVSASIPASQIHKMSEYGEVYRVGDGEGKLESFSFTDMAHAKQVVNGNNVGDRKTYDYTGDGVKVGVIDFGLAINTDQLGGFTSIHRDLPKHIFEDVVQCIKNNVNNVINCNTAIHQFGVTPYDNHATSIVGIIAGQDTNGNNDGLDMIGISPDINIGSISLEHRTSLHKDFLAALDWLLQNDYDVISYSIGNDRRPIGYTTGIIIMDEAVDKGLTLVGSFGNCYDVQNIFAKGINTISVGAIDKNKEYTFWPNSLSCNNLTTASSIGPVIFFETGDNIPYLKPEIVAPGTDVLLTISGNAYGVDSGTSFATPFVAGAAALLKEASPGITPMEIRAALLVSAEWDPQGDITQYPVTAKIWEDIAVADQNSRTAHQTSTYDYLNKYGFGVLDIEKAIDTVTTPDRMVRDYFEDSITPKTYTTEHIPSGEQVKILLTWDIHPIDTIAKIKDPHLADGAQPYHHYSNNDFTVTSPSGVSISSDSAYQNKEFAVFTASESGVHTVTISNGYLSSVGGQDNFALASNFALTPSSSSQNTHPPTVNAVEQFTMSTIESELLIAVSGDDQDNNPLSFVITDEPDYGTLSVGEQFGPTHTYFRYHLNPGVSSVNEDTFTVRAFDGKNYSAEKTLSIKTENLMDGSITQTNLNAPDNLNTKTLSFSAPTTKQFSVDSSSAIQSIYARSSNVAGSTLHFTSSGNSYTMKIPEYSARTIVFDEPSTISNVYITTAGLVPDTTSGLLSLGYSSDISEISQNSIPTANDVTTDAAAGNQVHLTLTGVDSDLGAGESLDFIITDPPQYGTLSNAPFVPNLTSVSAGITYTAHSTFSGVDSFSYVTRDDQGASSEHATVTINVSPPNLDRPTAYSQTTQTSQNESITVNLSGFDPQDEQLAFSILPGTPAHGVTSSVTPLGKDSARITYTPDSNYIGDDTISFRASNGLKHSLNADIVVSVNPHTNNPPTALPDSVNIAEDTSSYVIPVLSNDLDADISDFADSIAIHSIDDSGLVGGTAVISADKASISFTPNQNYDQTSRFYYTITDSHSATSSLTPVTVTIIPQNDPPVASADNVTVKKDSDAIIIDVLNNDFDVDTGDSLTIASADNTGTSGVASVIHSGKSISFTPSAGYTGTTSFTYDITDNSATSTATVTVNVNNLEGQAMLVIDYADAELKAYHPISGEYVGTLVTSRSGGLSSPSGVLFNGIEDYVLVSDSTGKIFQYNATTGQHIGNVISDGTISPRDMAWGPDGNLYVADSNSKILMYDIQNGFAKSEFIPSVYGGSGVRSLEFDSDGNNLYVEISSNRIIKYDSTTGASLGVIVDTKDQSSFGTSSGFTMGPDNKFYILDGYNDKIVRYTTSGQYDGEFIPSASGLSLVHLNWGPDGYLYVSGEKDYKSQIYRYAIDGTLVDLFVGKYSNGGLKYPHDIVFADIPFYAPGVINDLNVSVLSTSRISINWSEPDSHNSDILGYTIERRETLGTSSFQVIFDGLPKDTSYTDTALDADTSYTYRISSYNIIGKSMPSGDVVSVTMQESANVPPITNDDVYYIPKNTSMTLPVLNNDYDADDDTITITATSTPENGTIIINQNNPNTITFTPDAGFMGQNTITYTITARGDSATGTITVILQDQSEYPMYVASEGTDSVMLFSGDGQYKKQFVSAGSGGLDSPRALAISPDGTYMYVSDTRNDKILQYYSHNGTYVGSISSTDLADPTGMAFGPDGYLYVSSEDRDKILQIDTHAGVSLGTFGFAESENSLIDSPQKIAWHDDHLYVASGQSEVILRYDSMGMPDGITTADPDNGGIFSDIPDYDYPASVAWGPDGSLYVGDSRANKIFQIDGLTGASLGQYDTGGMIDDPQGLAFDYSTHGTKNDLFVANEDDDNIVKINGPSSGSPGTANVIVPRNTAYLNDPNDILFAPMPNHSPYIAQISDVTIPAGQSYSIPISATDYDSADKISFDIITPQQFVTLTDNSDNTGTITINPGIMQQPDTYTVTLRAIDDANPSKSDIETFAITVNPAPSLPDMITNLASSATSDNSISLSWNAPENDGNSVITDYIIQYRNSTDLSWSGFSDGVSAVTATTVTGLHSGVLYEFRVSSVNSVGAGQYSDAILARTIIIDNTSPTVIISSDAGIHGIRTNMSPIGFTVTFSENVTGFVSGDVVVFPANHTISGFSGAGDTYTFDVIPSTDGTITVSVPSGVATDAANNGNVKSDMFALIYDGTAPSVTLLASNISTNVMPIPINATFSESMTGFASSDIVASPSNVVISGFSGAGDTYTFDVIPSTDGTITVSVPSGVASDAAKNNNTPSNVLSILYDTIPPVITPISDAMISAAAGQNLTPVVLVAPAVNDNSGETITPTNDAPILGYPLGTTKVTWSASDSAGNISTITQNVIVGNTCGLQIDTGNVISFAGINPDDISGEQTMTIHNTGTVNGTLSMYGTDWTNNGTAKINVNSTKYSILPAIPYDSKMSLGTTPANSITIPSGSIMDVFWQLKVNLIDGTFTGQLKQDINVNVSC